MAKIAFIGSENWEAEYIQKNLAVQSLQFYGLDKEPADSEAEILTNFIDFPVDEKTLQKFPKVKLVATRSTGYDHIDLKLCAQKGVVVCNVPTYGENTVAEFTFALLLALSRKMYPAIKQVRERADFGTRPLEGFDLKDKILGVVGTGHIGTYVVKIARGFGMNVLAFDPHPKPELAKEFGFTYASLNDLFRQSDIVTLHVPYLPATHHLINQDKIKLFKKGSILINTARGGLVETASLVRALKEGILAGAGLDVLEEEGFVKEELHMLLGGHPNQDQLKVALADHELMHMDNVIITPHNAFNSREAVQRILDTTAQNIQKFLAGQPVNVVK